MRAPAPPRLAIYPDARAAARALTDRIVAAIDGNPRLVLGLPTGRTPIDFYHELSSRVEQGTADLSQATTFNLDEFVGIPADHPGSFRSFMNTHLFGRVNLSPERIHFLNGAAIDTVEECARYEREIAALGGIDIQILGVGSNGHIGFNEPAPALAARTHRVTLEPETRRGNAELFGGDPTAVPPEALSMGIATILQARAIVLVATGAGKASIVERLLRGPITTELPGSFLQVHPDVEILLDEAAAAGLRATR
jgi:glucosamine-6-phosphate deaminase